MAPVLEECTTKEQRSVVRLLKAKRLNAKDIHKEIVYVYGGICLSRKAVHSYGKKCFSDVEEDEAEVRKWLRQQPKDLYAAGFDALLKRWEKCINAGGVYVEK
jgi:hypothetical protein